MKLLKKVFIAGAITIVALIATPKMMPGMQVNATSIRLNKTTKTIYEGNTYTLKVKGTNKKVTWSSSDKSVAKVNSKGKVTAKKNGKATITAKVGSKKLKCKIKVRLAQYSKKFENIDKYALGYISCQKVKNNKSMKFDLDGDGKKDIIKVQLKSKEYLNNCEMTVNGKKFLEGIFTKVYVVDINKKDNKKEVIIKDAEATDGPGFIMYSKKGNKMKKSGNIGMTMDLKFNGKGKILSAGDDLNISPRVYTKYYTLEQGKIKRKIPSANKLKNIKFTSKMRKEVIKNPKKLKNIYPGALAEMIVKYSYIDENGNEVQDEKTNLENEAKLKKLGVQKVENIKFNIFKFGKFKEYDTIKIKTIDGKISGFMLNYYTI